MVIDLILDRKDGEPYNPKHFYNECMDYSAIFDGMFDAVTLAMDYGTEKDVKEALCKYIKDCEYNPEMCFLIKYLWKIWKIKDRYRKSFLHYVITTMQWYEGDGGKC